MRTSTSFEPPAQVMCPSFPVRLSVFPADYPAFGYSPIRQGSSKGRGTTVSKMRITARLTGSVLAALGVLHLALVASWQMRLSVLHLFRHRWLASPSPLPSRLAPCWLTT